MSVQNLQATNGTLVDKGDGTYTFTPVDENFTGVKTITYGVSDGNVAVGTEAQVTYVSPISRASGLDDIEFIGRQIVGSLVIYAKDLHPGWSHIDDTNFVEENSNSHLSKGENNYRIAIREIKHVPILNTETEVADDVYDINDGIKWDDSSSTHVTPVPRVVISRAISWGSTDPLPNSITEIGITYNVGFMTPTYKHLSSFYLSYYNLYGMEEGTAKIKLEAPNIIIESDADTKEISGENHFEIVEGGGKDFRVKLNVAPTADVVVNFTFVDNQKVDAISPNNMTFTTSNWHTFQTVTITTKDNNIDTEYEGSSPNTTNITCTSTSLDSGFNTLSKK